MLAPLLLAFTLTGPAPVPAATRNVLLLHSYHSGYGWSDAITAGVRRVLAEQRMPLELWIEFLDTQRDPSRRFADRQAQYLAAKYAQHHVAVVIAADDAAVQFVLDRRSSLFPGVPIVFCGVNDERLVDRLPRDTFTGIKEQFEPLRMIDTSVAILPGTRRVVVITEDTATAQYLRDAYRSLAPTRPALHFEFLDGHEQTLEQILGAIAKTGPGDLIVTSAFHLDYTGRYFPLDEALSQIISTAHAPVVSPGITDVRPGLLLGSENGGDVHGQRAAHDALRILNGEAPVSIPVQNDEAGHLLANAVEFDRRGLDLDNLPPEVLVVNRAPSFVREHSGLVAGTVAFIAVQTLAIAVLVANVRRRRRAEGRLASQARLLAMSNANLEAANRSLLAEQEERQKAEERLLHAQKMDAIGRLAGGVAHDFNNLLTVIAGYSDLVLTSVEPGDPVRPSVQEIRKAADRAGSLTHQLLAFSRKQVLQPTVTDLNAVVADMQKMLRRLIGDDVALETDLSPALPPVLVDEGQWQQVIVNLAVNARDAMQGGGILRIRTRLIENPSEAEPRAAAVLPPGPYVLLEVSDTGAGMDPQVLAQIFEPFFTTKQRDKGVGLGLAMVYGIVKQSGGWIWVESSPGTGATFRMYLPATRAQVRSDIREPHQTPTTAAGETIMLVEDQPEVRRLAARVLRGRGYDVLEASGGEEALALAAAHRGRLHLLVTDVVMPGMKGPEVAARLVAARPGLPVLYVSGYADEVLGPREDLLAQGMLLLKPFSPETLSARVRELLDGSVGPVGSAGSG